MTVACISIASIGSGVMARFTTDLSSDVGRYLVVSMVFFFIINFAYGWGPIVWVYNSEIFPLRYRSQCIATAACSNWVGNYAIAQCTPVLL